MPGIVKYAGIQQRIAGQVENTGNTVINHFIPAGIISAGAYTKVFQRAAGKPVSSPEIGKVLWPLPTGRPAWLAIEIIFITLQYLCMIKAVTGNNIQSLCGMGIQVYLKSTAAKFTTLRGVHGVFTVGDHFVAYPDIVHR